MINREDEMEWYENQFSRLEEDKMLSAAVQFDGWGNDVPQWFNNIGYILSLSDFEAMHLAVAEGASSGTVPVILNWRGAKAMYPSSWCHDDLNSMTSSILEFSHNDSKRKKFAKIIEKRYDLPRVYGVWSKLIGTKPTMYSTLSRFISRKKRSNQEWSR